MIRKLPSSRKNSSTPRVGETKEADQFGLITLDLPPLKLLSFSGHDLQASNPNFLSQRKTCLQEEAEIAESATGENRREPANRRRHEMTL